MGSRITRVDPNGAFETDVRYVRERVKEDAVQALHGYPGLHSEVEVGADMQVPGETFDQYASTS